MMLKSHTNSVAKLKYLRQCQSIAIWWGFAWNSILNPDQYLNFPTTATSKVSSSINISLNQQCCSSSINIRSTHSIPARHIKSESLCMPWIGSNIVVRLSPSISFYRHECLTSDHPSGEEKKKLLTFKWIAKSDDKMNEERGGETQGMRLCKDTGIELQMCIEITILTSTTWWRADVNCWEWKFLFFNSLALKLTKNSSRPSHEWEMLLS